MGALGRPASATRQSPLAAHAFGLESLEPRTRPRDANAAKSDWPSAWRTTMVAVAHDNSARVSVPDSRGARGSVNRRPVRREQSYRDAFDKE